MKQFIFPGLAALFVLISTISVSAEEWTLKSSEFTAKGGERRIEVTGTANKCIISANVNEDNLIIEISNGKAKFGAPVFAVTIGDSVFSNARFAWSVPMKDVKKVRKGSPAVVSAFSVKEAPYELSLVHSGGAVPDVVITSK